MEGKKYGARTHTHTREGRRWLRVVPVRSASTGPRAALEPIASVRTHRIDELKTDAVSGKLKAKRQISSFI